MISTCFVLPSCKKYFDPPIIFEKDVPQNGAKERKVLLLVVDGLSGLELKNYKPKNLSTILPQSKYSFEGISDGDTGDAATWTTILSGKSHSKHGVLGNTFDKDPNEDDLHGTITSGYITVFQRFLESGKNIKTTVASDLKMISDPLLGLADNRIIVDTDVKVKDSLVSQLEKTTNLSSFYLANFRSVNDAGLKSSFKVSSPEYKSAIDQVDEYIGNILSTIKNRKSYDKEDWLVVITSNHGGIGNTYGGATLEERKIPIIFYHPQFKELQYAVPDLKNSLTVDASNAFNPTILNANASKYEIGNSGEFTIMAKVLVKTKSGSNSVLFGKTTHAYSGTKGWHFMIESATTKFRVILGDGTLYFVYAPSSFTLNKWHNVALKVYNKDGKRYATLYQDGVAGTPVDITGKNITGTGNLFVGPGSSSVAFGASSAMVNNLSFFNLAVPDTYISDFACKQFLNNSDSYWNNLLGYWPMDEGSGFVFKNQINTGAVNTDFNFSSAPFSWNLSSSWKCSNDVIPNEKILNSVDILPNIYYWLNVKTADSWLLEGQPFLNIYETEFLTKR